MLRVRTGLKALRAVGGSFFKLWESEEKLTGRNTPLAFRKTKGLRNSEKSRPVPAGGRRQGGGERANSAPEKPPLSHPANRPRVLFKDFLRPDQRRGPRREKARRTRGETAKTSGCLSRSPRREKARLIWGEGTEAPGCLNR